MLSFTLAPIDDYVDECKKAGKILASFVDPRQSFGPDKVIPPSILANAKVRSPVHQSPLMADWCVGLSSHNRPESWFPRVGPIRLRPGRSSTIRWLLVSAIGDSDSRRWIWWPDWIRIDRFRLHPQRSVRRTSVFAGSFCHVRRQRIDCRWTCRSKC